MSRIQSINQFKRFNRFRNFAIYIILLSGLIVSLTSVNFRSLVHGINNFSNLIIAILTLFLVTATIFYAWITFRMLAEMVESRKSEIRPILWVTLEKPQFIYEDDLKSRCLLNKLTISNFGRVSAINTQIKLSIPHKEGNDKTPGDYISNRLSQHIPKQFTPGAINENNISIHTNIYDLNKYKKEFLELNMQYEDVERNLYTVIMFYDLFISSFQGQGKETYYWSLVSEEIYLLPFSDRKFVSDRSEIYSVVYGKEKDKLIFKRRQPWKS